jgi:murein DD-endopeptidase MepM/ murein hydrolase activator NlpD
LVRLRAKAALAATADTRGRWMIEGSTMIRASLTIAATAAAAATLAAGTAATPPSRPAGAGFHLISGQVTPHHAFFDGERAIRLRYRFDSRRPVDLVIRVVHSGGAPVRRWVMHDLRPGEHLRRWDGRRSDGGVAGDGTYRFRIGPPGHHGATVGSFELHGHRFPVDGPHSYGDTFGEPRSGGRVHEGQDLPAPCGTRLVAARGGRVQARGYSDALYGYWVLIDGRATRHDHFYAHLQTPSPLTEGERVRTGQTVGAVGKTGNARSEFCQLHFELWPHGYRHDAPQDPAPLLREWDAFS